MSAAYISGFPLPGGIAAQRNNMADPAIPVIFGNGTQLITAGVDTGQDAARPQVRTLLNTFDNAMGTVRSPELEARRLRRDKLRLQDAEAIDGFPEGLLHFTGARRKELKETLIWPLYFPPPDSGLPC